VPERISPSTCQAKANSRAIRGTRADDAEGVAVVHEGRVAFNTESCELEVLDTAGRPLWKKWLGDPLMSMPATTGGRVYQVYPDSRGDRRHYLAAFDLAAGRTLWKQPLPGEIITAPVLAEGHVYVANLDGTLSCFRQDDGAKVWQEAKSATSSPMVWEGECYFSRRKEVLAPRGGAWLPQQMEELAMRGQGDFGLTSGFSGTLGAADYLDHEKRKRRSPHYAACAKADAGVGFAFFKGDAKMGQAEKHLGHRHVSGSGPTARASQCGRTRLIVPQAPLRWQAQTTFARRSYNRTRYAVPRRMTIPKREVNIDIRFH
jgi:hypothetical protein